VELPEVNRAGDAGLGKTDRSRCLFLPLSREPSSVSLPLLPLLLLLLLPNDIPQRIINYLIKPRALEAREVSGKKIFAPLKADARERDRQRKLRRIARWQIRRGSSTGEGRAGRRSARMARLSSRLSRR